MGKVLRIILGCLLVLSLSSCGEEEDVNVLPVEPVNLKISLLVDNELRTPGNFKEYIKGTYPALAGEYLGYGGLLVVRTIYDEEIPFYAFDLSCPHEKVATVRVKPSNQKGTVATCEKCGRVYNLLENGRISSESSNLHLQRYRVVPTSSPDVFYIAR